ncbi:hypothetical protein AVEN_143004-1, partial [Araneus ventricosus]
GAQAHGPDIALLIFGDHQQHRMTKNTTSFTDENLYVVLTRKLYIDTKFWT